MKKVIQSYYLWVNHLLSKQINGSGLALFRIAYSIVLLCEISQIIYFRHLIYDKIPFVVPSEINMLPGLLVWMISVIFLLFGFYTRKAALINYILSLVFIGTIKSYEYHVFYTYMGVNFIFLFLDISQNHSIDRLRKKIKYSTSRFMYNPQKTIGAWHYFLPIAVGVGFVYFDSIFFKFTSYNWMNGLGMWLPASLPMTTHADMSFFLNIKWLAIGLGYLTVVFETVFLFTFFLKRWRIPLLIIGTGLHIGIIVIFPIPWFGLSVLAIYLLMVPVSFWDSISNKLKRKDSLTIFYDEDCPLCARTKVIITHFDCLKKIKWEGIESTGNVLINAIAKEKLLSSMHAIDNKGKIVSGLDSYRQIFKRIPFLFLLFIVLSVPVIRHVSRQLYNKIASIRLRTHCTDTTCGYVSPEPPKLDSEIKIFRNLNLHELKSILWGTLFLFFTFLQLNVTSNSKLFAVVKNRMGVDDIGLVKSVSSISKKIWGVSKIMFGVTRHGVFMDEHFDGYNHIVGIEATIHDGSKIWLPIINKNGTAGWYDYSFNWVKWTFRVVDNHIQSRKLDLGIRDFATFWAVNNGHDLQVVKFNIFVRSLEIPTEWEEDFLKKQKAKKWKMIGQAYWQGDQFITDFPDIETIKFDE
jgi:predicted DCC family thiol-disulfide oxidoreductase YuxK